MKALAAAGGLFLAGVITVGALGSSEPSPSGGPGPYPRDVVARASVMTEQMSGPTDAAHAYHLHAGDEQLRLSADPAFVRQVESYRDDLDRMLARKG